MASLGLVNSLKNQGAATAIAVAGGDRGLTNEKSMLCDGTDDMARCGNAGDGQYFGTGDFTLSAWAKTTSTSSKKILTNAY